MGKRRDKRYLKVRYYDPRIKAYKTVYCYSNDELRAALKAAREAAKLRRR